MMKNENIWGVIIGLSLGTFLIRSSFIYLSSKVKVSPRLKSTFSLIPAAIFPALIVPMAFFHRGVNESLFYKERFFVLIISALICFKFRNILVCIVSGLALLYLLT